MNGLFVSCVKLRSNLSFTLRAVCTLTNVLLWTVWPLHLSVMNHQRGPVGPRMKRLFFPTSKSQTVKHIPVVIRNFNVHLHVQSIKSEAIQSLNNERENNIIDSSNEKQNCSSY